MTVEQRYKYWCDNVADPTLSLQLSALKNDPSAMEDCFFCDLEFGTAGLRAKMGVGSSRINLYTIRRATKGVADFLMQTQTVKCT
ncbi:MAG: phospho-sugar mutase, partial [Clostridiales bacterium]|nr:phospho-sugar mutase [Clostridiales bacterium]